MQSTVFRDRAYKTLSGPGEVQQGPGVSSSDYEPLTVLRSARRPKQGHQAPINKAFIEKYYAPRQAQGEASQ